MPKIRKRYAFKRYISPRMSPAVVAALPQNVQEGMNIFSGLADTRHFASREQFLAHKAAFVRARRDLGASLQQFGKELERTPAYASNDPATRELYDAVLSQSKRLDGNDMLTEQITQMTLQRLPHDPRESLTYPISVSFQQLSDESRALAEANPRTMTPQEVERASFLTLAVHSRKGGSDLGGGKSGNVPYSPLEIPDNDDSPLAQDVQASHTIVKQASRVTTYGTKAEKGQHILAGRLPYTAWPSRSNQRVRVEDGLREVATQATAEILGFEGAVVRTTLARDTQSGAAFAMEKVPGTQGADWVYAAPGGREAMEAELQNAHQIASRLGENRRFVEERFSQIRQAGQDPERLFGVSQEDVRRWKESQRFASKQVAEFTPHFTQQVQQLQVVDIITGQRDRHPGNFFVFRDADDFGLRAIDNSAAFDTNGTTHNLQAVIHESFPAVDRDTYEAVQGLDPNVLEDRLVGVADGAQVNQTKVLPALRTRVEALQAHFETLSAEQRVYPVGSQECARIVYDSMREHRSIKPRFMRPGEMSFAKKELSGPVAKAFETVQSLEQQAALDNFEAEGVAAAADMYVKHHRLGSDYDRSFDPPGIAHDAAHDADSDVRQNRFKSFGENIRIDDVFHAIRGVREFSGNGGGEAPRVEAVRAEAARAGIVQDRIVYGGVYSEKSAPTHKQAMEMMRAISLLESSKTPLKPWEIREALIGGLVSSGSDMDKSSTRKMVREAMSRLEHHFPSAFKMPGSSAKVSEVYDILRNHRGFGGLDQVSARHVLFELGEKMQERFESGASLSEQDIRGTCANVGVSEKETNRIVAELGRFFGEHAEYAETHAAQVAYSDRFQGGAFLPPVPVANGFAPPAATPPVEPAAQAAVPESLAVPVPAPNDPQVDASAEVAPAARMSPGVTGAEEEVLPPIAQDTLEGEDDALLCHDGVVNAGQGEARAGEQSLASGGLELEPNELLGQETDSPEVASNGVS